MEKQNTKQTINQITKNNNEESPILHNLQQQIQKITQEIKQLFASQNPNQIHINSKIKTLLKIQTKFHNIKQLYLQSNESTQLKPQQKPISIQSKIALIQKQSEQYEPTIQQINQKRQTMQQQLNDDGWTDATQSQTGTLGPDGIMVFDDDMLQQMLGKNDKQSDEEQEQEQQQQIDFNQLQKQFVTGKQSNQDYLFGKHQDKFCVSVCSVLKQNLVISGGGDDQLHLYKFQTNKQPLKVQQNIKQQTTQTEQKQTQTKKQQSKEGEQIKQKLTNQSKLILPFKIIPHHQTIDLVDLSFDKQNLFSLTQKELICTNLKTLQTTKTGIDPPTQFACHQQGGVFAIANAFNVQIYNIKGFKFYDSFCLDQEVSLLKWTLNGKQLVAACDNKLRIVTPKTRQVTKVTGTAFHEGQITTMSLIDNTIFTGCIDGYVYASNITKGQILGGTPKLQATINTLCAAQNYLIVGPAKNSIYWFDSNKLKQLFTNQFNGSSTDIIQLATKNQYAVSDIQGEIHLFDKRNPIQQKFLLKAGNTVHKLWHEENLLLAACQDGCVRGWDLRKYQY